MLVGTEDGTSYVPVEDWQAHLGPFYRTFVRIKVYQHFSFKAAHPGKVFVKTCVDSPVTTFNLMVGDVCELPRSAPVAVTAPGMTAQCQWYLHDSIREYVPEDQKDILCPLPSVPKPAACVTKAEKKIWCRGYRSKASSLGTDASTNISWLSMCINNCKL